MNRDHLQNAAMQDPGNPLIHLPFLFDGRVVRGLRGRQQNMIPMMIHSATSTNATMVMPRYRPSMAPVSAIRLNMSYAGISMIDCTQ
jgi:hypothetical protein